MTIEQEAAIESAEYRDFRLCLDLAFELSQLKVTGWNMIDAMEFVKTGMSVPDVVRAMQKEVTL